MTAYVPGITETDLKKIILSLQQLASGRSNAVGSMELTTGTTTTVNNDNCAEGSTVLFTPTTSSAAAAVSGMYLSAVANKSFTLTHAAGAAGRVFRFAIVG